MLSVLREAIADDAPLCRWRSGGQGWLMSNLRPGAHPLFAPTNHLTSLLCASQVAQSVDAENAFGDDL
eukprot:2261182-Rhodomonas_salina.1